MSITKNSIKLYGHLDSQQKAALAVNALLNKNVDEIERITQTVPKFTYSATDANYSRKAESLFDVAALFAITFWRNEYYRGAANGLLHLRDAQQAGHEVLEPEQLESTESALQVWISYSERQAANVEVMRDVCQQHGLDFEAVLSFAEIDAFHLEQSKSFTPAQEWLEGYSEAYRRISEL